jgi:hypothetical protein
VTSKEAPSGTFLTEKEPSEAVMLPLVVPCTTTPAPMMPAPEASRTNPEIVLWAHAAGDSMKTAASKASVLIKECLFILKIDWLISFAFLFKSAHFETNIQYF